MERNPAYQTSASLIPSSSNPSYAGLNVTANAQVYEDVSALYYTKDAFCTHARFVAAMRAGIY